MLTLLFIYNAKGDVLISKLFREGVKRNIADVFRVQVITNNDLRSPILTLGSTTFLHIKYQQIWIVLVTRSNVDASLVFESLYKLLRVLQGNMSITESEIKLNFTLIYEILDELYLFGYPQTVELTTQKLVLTPVKLNSTTNKLIGRRTSILKRRNSSLLNLSAQPPSDVPWRQAGIKYRKNEIYLDVLENVNLLVSSNGTSLRSYVEGKIRLKAKLSGMPVCNIGLNNSGNQSDSDISLDDFQFHQCVDSKLYDQERQIKFIPPDGEFDLMSYRSNENIDLPFKVVPILTQTGPTTLELQVVINSLYLKKTSANDVEFVIPVPNGTIKTNIQASMGKLKFDLELNSIVWKSNKFLGLSTLTIKAQLEINNSANILNWTKPPMILKFTINMFSCSGLNIRYFRIENSTMKLIKWVKYITKSGSYEIRY